jgi:L-aminopeptidase/D-esterase-like protein
MKNNTLTALSGVSVGHSTHPEKLTGVTVVIFDRDLPVAYKSYGGSLGTFNTDTFTNGKSDSRAHALFITGGSWHGLRAGAEIMNQLAGNGIGYRISKKIVNPCVAGAVVYDLGMRIDKFDQFYGKEAVDNVTKDPVERGNVGAGTGTSVGKFRYFNDGKLFAGMKAGVGCSRVDLGNGAMVCALSVVNAVGNIILPDGSVLAGNRDVDNNGKLIDFEWFSDFVSQKETNTTITIVGTNVNLRHRENYERVAHLATHGQVRAINPVNTSLDGDTVFVFSTEQINSFMFPGAITKVRGVYWNNLDVDIIGQAAARATQESIYDACRSSESIKLNAAYKGIVPSSKDYWL